VVAARTLADDDVGDKERGYGRATRIALDGPDGPCAVVFHTARADDFGHDRRADRVANMVLAYDTYDRIPRHVRVVDVGLLDDDGGMHSIATTGEPYLITSWVDGTLYADDLRRIAITGVATELDVARAEALANALVDIHAAPGSRPGAYRRAIRDLLGHGEGIFGLIDSYPDDTPAAPPARLRAIEEACLAWRWKLRDRGERLRRTHGDFHPFNLVFGQGTTLSLLDASRGCEGDPADDVACLAINYPFFSVGRPESWPRGTGVLWRRFWTAYLARGDGDVVDAVAPYFAWRGLVLASPLWYPHITSDERDRILRFVERALTGDRFDPFGEVWT
jgi:hypothetical protein